MYYYEYRNTIYGLCWRDGVCYFVIQHHRQIFRGTGNHGVAKDMIDRIFSI